MRKVAEAGAAGGVPTPDLVTQALVRTILTHYLGEAWFGRHVLKSRPGAFFHAPAAPYAGRAVDLVEHLYNLQHVEGAAHPVSDLREEAAIASAVARLQIGRMLLQDAVPFRYLPPAARGPDLEIRVDGLQAFADIGARHEIAAYAKGDFKSLFDGALKGVGHGAAAIVFLRVPRKWTTEAGARVAVPRQALDECRHRMSRAPRIVKTVFHATLIGFDDAPGRPALLEVPSPANAPASPWNRPLFQFNGRRAWPTLDDLIARATAS